MPTEPNWLDDTQQEAWRSYLDAHNRLVGALNGSLSKRHGISLGDYEVLVHLSEAEVGGLRPIELAGLMGWEKSRLSHHLSRMIDRGLVVREPCLTDRRGSWIRMSAEGRDTLKSAAPDHVDDVRDYFVNAVGSDDLQVLNRASRRISEQIAGSDAEVECEPDSEACSESDC
ncbi:MAG TPA: MarR family winged helix-turn-helix transcriptional regulator [Microthrixaceae bacterium]|nr:MarR family winged helix-turn-helix transcriptional regulator [Microthrixaceae bacterium]